MADVHGLVARVGAGRVRSERLPSELLAVWIQGSNEHEPVAAAVMRRGISRRTKPSTGSSRSTVPSSYSSTRKATSPVTCAERMTGRSPPPMPATNGGISNPGGGQPCPVRLRERGCDRAFADLACLADLLVGEVGEVAEEDDQAPPWRQRPDRGGELRVASGCWKRRVADLAFGATVITRRDSSDRSRRVPCACPDRTLAVTEQR